MNCQINGNDAGEDVKHHFVDVNKMINLAKTAKQAKELMAFIDENALWL